MTRKIAPGAALAIIAAVAGFLIIAPGHTEHSMNIVGGKNAECGGPRPIQCACGLRIPGRMG